MRHVVEGGGMFYVMQNDDCKFSFTFLLFALKQSNICMLVLDWQIYNHAEIETNYTVAVLGHVGLTPQAISVLGGFRAQGRTASRARLLIDEALRLQDAGAFAIVLECIPANVATAITDALDIPTIGIGAGGGTSGQVLVFHDLLGMLSHPHHEEFVPKFCKKYASVGIQINDGLAQFKKEVEDGVFPGAEYSPYKMNAEEEARFDEVLLKDANDENKLKSEATTSKLDTADASGEELSLYGNNKQQTDK